MSFINRSYLEPEQKALEINLNDKVYGSFAEIGAGQEVARYFFQAGGAAGTIAKTMSAYDKVVSDKIYGAEEKGRYVCESRLYKMLDHEYELMVNRLSDERPATCFFAFADTVAAINYHKTVKGDGWMGVRFQLEPQEDANEIVLHFRLLDNDNQLQQQATGILGVNLIYACFNYQNDIEKLILSLMDNLAGRVSVDLLRITGPNFRTVDNRLVALNLVNFGLTDVTIFDPTGRPLHASELVYKKPVLMVRGSWHPPTVVNMDMLKSATHQFKELPNIDGNTVKVFAELTIDNLKLNGDIDVQDYLDRVDILGKMGMTVAISNCEEYRKMIAYFSDYKVPSLGIVLGVKNLLKIVESNFYKYKDGSLLAAFGELFTKDVKFLVYPALMEGNEELMTSQNMPLPEGIKFLYRHLLDSGQIIDMVHFKKETLHIYSQEVLQLLRGDHPDWDKYVPDVVAKYVREKCLFGFPCQRMEFEY